MILHNKGVAKGGIGIGGPDLPAPQAGLMAQLATGIIGGEMPWGLIIIGIGLAIALILIKAPAPMLIAVGMYLPLETTFAIFVGGVIKAAADRVAERKLDPEGRTVFGNVGILLASGFVAGEALTGVILAAFVLLSMSVLDVSSMTEWIFGVESFSFVEGHIGGWLSLLVFAGVAIALIRIPYRAALDRQN